MSVQDLCQGQLGGEDGDGDDGGEGEEGEEGDDLLEAHGHVEVAVRAVLAVLDLGLPFSPKLVEHSGLLELDQRPLDRTGWKVIGNEQISSEKIVLTYSIASLWEEP